jgi:succinoglycan biosynthesis transport protein ExoP
MTGLAPIGGVAPWARVAPTMAESDWARYVSAVRDYRWIVLVVTLLGTVAGVFAAGQMRPQYVSSAVLWVERTDAGAAARGAPGAWTLESSSWSDLLRSNAVLDSVVRGLRLYLTPRSPTDLRALTSFDVGDAVVAGSYAIEPSGNGARYTLYRGDAVVERGGVGDSVGRAMGFRWAPRAADVASGERVEFTVASPADVAVDLARRLEIDVDATSTFLKINLRDPDPARAAATLNAVGERAVRVGAALKRQRLEQLERILGGQYRHAAGELRAAERAMADFRIGAIRRMERSAGGVAPNAELETAALAELSATLDELRRDRRGLEDLLRQAAGGALRLDALGEFVTRADAPRLARALDTAMERETVVRDLRRRYTDESQPVILARTALEEVTHRELPALVRAYADELAVQERELAPRVDRAFASLKQAPELAIQQERLQRRLSGAEALFAEVGERYENTRLSLLSSLPDLHILDRALAPQTPTGDLRAVLIALSFISSFVVAVLAVRAYQGLDTTIRRPEQVTEGMRLTILGCIPHVDIARTVRAAIGHEETIEALRGLRMRLLQTRRNGPLCVTITSPSAGDGKSFVTVNLALSFAQAGYRTLLIDGDTRRGVQHRVLGAAPRSGLVEALAGTAALGDVIQATEHPGLSLISAGASDERAPELLAGPQFTEALTALRSRFDVILVDSPPLAAGVDALILGAVTTDLLLVLRTGATDLDLARAKLDAAVAHPIRLLGAVLNDVRENGTFRNYTYDLSAYGSAAISGTKRVVKARILGGRV